MLCARTGANTMFSSTVRCGNRLNAWKTMPRRRRTATGSTDGSVITSPSSRMSPSSISTRRSMQRSRVDLPEPEAPMTATAWCSETVRSTPCRTSLAPQAFVTPLTSKTGRLMSSPPRHATDSPAIDDAGERNRHTQIEESGAHKRRVVEGRGGDDLGLPERLDHTEDRHQGDVLLERDEVVQERRPHSPHRLGQDH